jgi:hypothetical protein
VTTSIKNRTFLLLIPFDLNRMDFAHPFGIVEKVSITVARDLAVPSGTV